MQSPYDVWAKGLLEGALQDFCEVRGEEESVADARAIDTLVVPLPDKREGLKGRGLLGRIGGEVCAIEAFQNPPGADEADECLLKVIALYLRERAAWLKEKPAERGEAPARAKLWIISAGDPEGLRAMWRMAPMAGWPEGCFTNGSERAPFLVVTSQLPRTRDTLLMRFLGRGETMRQARADFDRLPADAWEREALTSLFVLLRQELPRMGLGEYSPQEATMRFQEAREIYRREKAEAIEEGRQEGHQQGLQEGLAIALRMVERKLGRSLEDAERATFEARFKQLGGARLGDLVLDLDGPALDRWLHDPNAS